MPTFTPVSGMPKDDPVLNELLDKSVRAMNDAEAAMRQVADAFGTVFSQVLADLSRKFSVEVDDQEDHERHDSGAG